MHLTGAPYHPSTNGAAERLVQTFKQALRKSSKPPKEALQEFLLQYRRTPLADGYSPSELLNGRQIRAKIDALLPSPAHAAQGRQAKEASKSQSTEASVPTMARSTVRYEKGQPCYALYFGPRRDKDPRWVPAIVTKICGSRSVKVRVYPRGPTWRRHIEQLRPRFGIHEDLEPENIPTSPSNAAPTEVPQPTAGDLAGEASALPSAEAPPREASALPSAEAPPAVRERRNPRAPHDSAYDAQHPRRSTRMRKPRELYSAI